MGHPYESVAPQLRATSEAGGAAAALFCLADVLHKKGLVSHEEYRARLDEMRKEMGDHPSANFVALLTSMLGG